MKKNILICDDDSSIVEVCRLILEKRNYHVEISRDCEKAIPIIKTVIPDIILLDLWLPEMGGQELLRLVKDDEATKYIPVILFSAHNDIEKIAEKMKADGFLKKPFDIQELIQIVNKQISPDNGFVSN